MRAFELPAAATRLEAIDGWRTEMPWLTSEPVVLTAHSTSEHYVLEIERDVASVATDSTAMIATLLEAKSWQGFAEQAVTALGQMFGYARTMAYTFHPDHHGEVIAEYLHQPGLEPFLGLHYPASDIPPQARRLYVLQLVRVIEDVDEPTVHLVGSASNTPAIKSRLGGGYCLRAPPQGSCPYANICEHCPSFHTDATHMGVRAAQRIDAQDLAADAEQRGWIDEADRHRKLIARLDALIAQSATA